MPSPPCAHPAITLPPADCLNCGAPLGTPRPRYCPACGQETNIKPPTLAEFAQQFGGSVLAAEGALWRTLRLLLTRPGALTCEYLRGRRRHYVLPLRLYLTVSLVVLLAMKLLGGLQIQPLAVGAQQTQSTSFTVLDAGGRRAGLDHGRFYCEQLPAWLCTRLERRLDLAPRSVQRELAELPERFIGHSGTAMFLLVPLFAALLKAVYWRRGLRYTEHLVFALHLHAFWFAAMALALLPLAPVAVAALLAMPAYAYLAARRVYGGSHISTALRGLLILTLYSAALAGALLAVLAWTFIA